MQKNKEFLKKIRENMKEIERLSGKKIRDLNMVERSHYLDKIYGKEIRN